MIPFFFTTYRKAPLATVVSYLSTLCIAMALIFSVGYFTNWEGLRDSGTSAGESLLVAAVAAVVGVALWKLAEYLADRKYKKLAAKASAGASGKPAVSTPVKPAVSAPVHDFARHCPKCGRSVDAGDAFCVYCGTKL